MSSKLQSANFDFLGDYDPLLVEYGLRAELNAYTDSNTSLVKSRQFGELLARCTASHAGMDCSDNKFDEILGLLKRHRLIPNEIYGYFTQVRLYGNAAVHEHESNRNAALQSLICAHELAKWFMQSVVETPDFEPRPFRPLPKPEDATHELQEEIDFLRSQAARAELTATATEAQIEELSARLEREAGAYQEELERQAALLQERDSQLDRLAAESTRRLRQVISVASSKAVQSFVKRSEVSSDRLRSRGDDTLPLTQLRIMTGQTSHCCDAPMILVQSMSGGFVTQNCPKCNHSRSLSRSDFENLDIYVACARCQHQTEPEMVGYNYGYRCSRCNWECELSALTPHHSDIDSSDN